VGEHRQIFFGYMPASVASFDLQVILGWGDAGALLSGICGITSHGAWPKCGIETHFGGLAATPG